MTAGDQQNLGLSRRAMQQLCFVVVAVLITACVQPEPVDLEVAREELLAADAAWSKTPPDAGRFAEFFVEGGRFMPPAAPEAVGREKILAVASQVFGVPGFSLTWSASSVQVAASGDQGYSMGTYTQTSGSSVPVRVEGKYVTLWRKDEDGRWRVVVDMNNANAPLQAPASAGPAAFFIAQYEVEDEAMYGEYVQAVRPIVSAYGGRPVIVDTTAEVLEGAVPGPHSVVLRFDSEDRLRAWYESAEYQQILGKRLQATEGFAVIARERATPEGP